MVKAVSLFSGSLASIVSTSIVRGSSGVEQTDLITFRSPFFENYERVKESAGNLWPDVNFRSQSVKKKCESLSNIPSGGQFRLKASCRGCRRLLLYRGKRFMERVDGDFLVTGEVVGRHGLGPEELADIDREAGVSGLVYRPLSAALLPDTVPEQEGWVGFRERFRDGCENQLATLARSYGINPRAVGFPAEDRCKLTDERYGRRLEDLLTEPNFTTNVLKLLEFDHYYKVPPDTKIVLGMSEDEKRELQNYFLPSDLRVYLPSHNGPMTLVRTDWQGKSDSRTEELIDLAGRITVYHSEASNLGQVSVNYRFENDSDTYRTDLPPVEKGELDKYKIDSKSPTT